MGAGLEPKPAQEPVVLVGRQPARLADVPAVRLVSHGREHLLREIGVSAVEQVDSLRCFHVSRFTQMSQTRTVTETVASVARIRLTANAGDRCDQPAMIGASAFWIRSIWPGVVIEVSSRPKCRC